jgi:hypothetical protein
VKFKFHKLCALGRVEAAGIVTDLFQSENKVIKWDTKLQSQCRQCTDNAATLAMTACENI